MNQLPVFSATAQGKPASGNSPAARDNTSPAADSQPFGQVLAKQLGEQNAANASQENLKGPTQTRTDALKSSLRKVIDVADDAALPAGDPTASQTAPDLLATLPRMFGEIPVQPVADSGTTAPDADSAPLRATGASARPLAMDEPSKPARTEPSAPAFTSAAMAAAALQAGGSRSADTPVAQSPDLTGIGAAAQPANPVALQLAATTPAAPPMQTAIATPIDHRQWADDFSQKITWLATQNQQRAELHLNPPQLGPLDITLKLNGDQATALFTSPHAVVREAIEQSLPKLREIFADNGIMLGGATVSDQSQREQHSESGNPSAAGFDIRHAETVGSAGASHTTRIVQHDGMVDTFA